MVDSFLGQAEEGNKTALLKLQLIGHYIMGGDFSITDLSHEMNLSVPTVTKLVSELIEEGFVHALFYTVAAQTKPKCEELRALPEGAGPTSTD